MGDSILSSTLKLTVSLACFGASALTSLWFLLLAIDSFKWQEGAGLPRADLGLGAQLALGAGVLAAASVFAWVGAMLLRRPDARRLLGPSFALLLVAGGMAALAASAPAFIHPVHEFADGVDRSLAGAVPWVTYFATVAAMALVGAVVVLSSAAVHAARGAASRRLAHGR